MSNSPKRDEQDVLQYLPPEIDEIPLRGYSGCTDTIETVHVS